MSAPIGRTNPHARRLRRDSTDAEKLLWQRLRSRQLGGFKFRRQVTIGPFIADFACIECKLIVEADGGQHNKGADEVRTSFLTTRGYHVMRFWNHDIFHNLEGVLEMILTAGEERRIPSPNPLPLAGEGL